MIMINDNDDKIISHIVPWLIYIDALSNDQWMGAKQEPSHYHFDRNLTLDFS